MSKTPSQSKRIRALNRAYRSGVEDAFCQVADWLGIVDDEEDEIEEEDVKREIMRLLGDDAPRAIRHLAADVLCSIRDEDADGEALFEHALDRDDWSLYEAALEGYTADEIVSLNLDGAPDPEAP